MIPALEKRQQEYRENGLCVIRSFVVKPSALMNKCQDIIVQHGTRRKNWKAGGKHGGPGEERNYNDWVLHYGGIHRYIIELAQVYMETTKTIDEVTRRRTTPSPYGRSAATLKMYEGVGGEHGWHVESNSVSGVLYLSNHPEEKGDGALEYCLPKTRSPVYKYWPKAGDLVIMRGHDVWHRVAPMTTNTTRMCAVFNYYHEGDVDRPDGLDDLHYGSDRTSMEGFRMRY